MVCEIISNEKPVIQGIADVVWGNPHRVERPPGDGLFVEQFLKYFWLEKEYLEKEVKPAFDNATLTDEQFFAIIFWKSKRRADLVRIELPNGAVQGLVKKIQNAQSKEQRLDILLSLSGFGIPMASAVLTILYPNEFTVYDYRVGEVVNEDCFKQYRNNGEKIRNVFTASRYWEFVETVRRIAKANGLSLRDCDRALWGKSWYEDLQKFVGVEKPVVQPSGEDL